MSLEIEKVLSLVRGTFTIKSVPCFINGDYSPVTRTHYDEYHNLIILLNGSKTFYLARQGAIVNTPTRNENETDSDPHDGHVCVREGDALAGGRALHSARLVALRRVGAPLDHAQLLVRDAAVRGRGRWVAEEL